MLKKRVLSLFLCIALAFSFSACEWGDVVDSLGGLGGGISGSSTVEDPDGESSTGTDGSSSSTGDKEEDSSSGAQDKDEDSSSSAGDKDEDGDTPPETIVSDDLSIHFLYFNNAVSGDCTLIKVGDTEVLIDAGSTRGSATTLISYINEYCTDGVLEYVIATHAHEDHIAGFVGEYGTDGIFSAFECKTIIDYTGQKTTSGISNDYKVWRDKEVEGGAVHYTALECWNNENGAKRSYTLGENITMNILYQRYYEESTANENNYSVCMLLTQGENNYLFTGDLESGGEASLVAKNNLPKCKLFKGGHHGSDTSNTMTLLNVIQPEIVCVCSCCGDKHGFPKQAFIDNVANFTDKVYITTMKDEATNKGVQMNGNIVVRANKEGITVNCSNNNILFKDSEWFKNAVKNKQRTCPDQWKEGA